MHGPVTSVTLLLLLTSALSAATVTAVPDRLTVDPGDTVTVTLQATDIPSSTAWGQLLRFDPTVLRCTAQSAGTLGIFTADSRSLEDINATGELRTGGLSLTPTTAGIDADLAVFTFEVVGSGVQTLLDVVAFDDATEPFGCVFLASGQETIPTVVDAQLDVTGPAVRRTIRLQVTRAGAVQDTIITVDPNHDSPEAIDDYQVFDDLIPGVDYLFEFLRPANG